MIQLLHRTAATYRNIRAQMTQLLHPAFQAFKGLGHPPDAVMQYRRTVERDDHVIHICCDGFSLRYKKQSCRQKGDPDSFIPKYPGQSRQATILLRLAPAKDDPSNA